MLYVDIPTRNEMAKLAQSRNAGSVSIYLKTTPLTQEINAAQIELGNLLREAQQQLQAIDFDKRELAKITTAIEDLLDDDEFWVYQATSLAIFVTPDHIRTYRLPNNLKSMVQVSDRFHLKPLFRAITFPQSAFILALSENATRLLEVHADAPAVEVKVDELPKSAASATGRPTLNDRSHNRRLHGSEGQNILLEQYARKVDSALRTVLAGRETPLILAATGRLASVFPQVCSYPYLLEQTIGDSPDRMTESELTAAARPILDASYQQEVAQLRELFSKRDGERRATTDISDAARAATYGAIDTLMVDIDTVVPGYIDDESGAVTFVEEDDAKAYGIVDEIAARALASGARVLGVRREDLPENHELAALLRYPL